MDFDYNEEQRMFMDAVDGFAERNLAEGALRRAHARGFPKDIAKMMSEQGLLGITMREEDGGQGGTLTDAVIAIQTVAKHCPRSADVVQAGNFGAIRVLAEYGTADQKERYLKPILAGDKVISVAMSEPEAGSALTDLKTTATPAENEGVHLNGTKVFSTHSPEADLFLVYCRYGVLRGNTQRGIDLDIIALVVVADPDAEQNLEAQFGCNRQDLALNAI